MRAKEKEWIKDFRSIVRRMPKRFEVLVNYGCLEVMESGSERRCFEATGDIDNASDYGECFEMILKTSGKFIPCSERL